MNSLVLILMAIVFFGAGPFALGYVTQRSLFSAIVAGTCACVMGIAQSFDGSGLAFLGFVFVATAPLSAALASIGAFVGRRQDRLRLVGGDPDGPGTHDFAALNG